MKYLPILLTCFALASATAHAMDITEDDNYIYTSIPWNEMADGNQRALMKYFDDQLCSKLNLLDVPTAWTQDAEQILLGNQDQFNNITSETQTRATDYAETKNIQISDFIPTGFILGIGVSGSGDFTIGVGGSALLTMIVVPIEVIRFDKTTGNSDSYFEVSWAIGGLGQGGVGVGAGGGAVFRGAIGLIWGALPSASDLCGVAVGATANITAVQGLGFKVAVVFNSLTKGNNLVALATIDIGAEAEAEVDGSLFYFMTANEIIGFMSSSSIDQDQGNDVIEASALNP